ncbi:MAG TPA: hypothetical protein VJS91_11010 [Nitrososphaeraceae archaeon]|nr:hypothetical protein [Nitrososphaeraceae archaeon]
MAFPNAAIIVPIMITIIILSLNISHGQVDNSSGMLNSNKIGIAQEIYQDKIISFGTNVKNIVLLIPNEGHESPALPQEQRLINQPYLPANIEVGPDTQISWINGDVGHKHTITVVDENSKEVYSSGKFDFNSLSDTLVLNGTGKYRYSESNVNVDDPKFVMEGTINVEDNPSSNNQLPQTVGFLMVPAKDLNEHFSKLTDKGIGVIDKYTFKDLRGGQKGTGPEQTLLLLGSPGDQEKLVSSLKSITQTLPYS